MYPSNSFGITVNAHLIPVNPAVFEKLLNSIAFGPSGEGYFRLTGFGTKENTIEAIERIKKMK